MKDRQTPIKCEPTDGRRIFQTGSPANLYYNNFRRNTCCTTPLHRAHGPDPQVCRVSAAFHLGSTDDPSPRVCQLSAALQVEPTVVLRSPGRSEELRNRNRVSSVKHVSQEENPRLSSVSSPTLTPRTSGWAILAERNTDGMRREVGHS